MSSMFNVNSYAGNTMNSIFRSLGTNNSSGMSSILGDYYSIQNGSYLKMAKKYYAKKASTDSSSKTNSTTTVDKDKLDAINKLSGTSTSASGSKKTETMKLADKAVSSVGDMLDSKLYNKVSVKDSDGNETKEYDREAILKGLKNFVSDYNSVVRSTAKSANSSTIAAAEKMTNQTDIYGSALEKIGVTIGKDNTLTIDEDAFNKADMTDVKSLFTGSVSFGKNTQMKLLQIYSADATGQSGFNSLYSSQATNNYSIGNMFDSLF